MRLTGDQVKMELTLDLTQPLGIGCLASCLQLREISIDSYLFHGFMRSFAWFSSRPRLSRQLGGQGRPGSRLEYGSFRSMSGLDGQEIKSGSQGATLGLMPGWRLVTLNGDTLSGVAFCPFTSHAR